MVKGNNSHGPTIKARVKRVLEVLLSLGSLEAEGCNTGKAKQIICRWQEEGDRLKLCVDSCQVSKILHQVEQNNPDSKVKSEDIRAAFGDLEAIGIFQDRRGASRQGSSPWHFDLWFNSRDMSRNLEEFDRAWDEKWGNGRNTKKAEENNQNKPDKWKETCRDLMEQWKGLTANVLTKSDGVRFQLDDIFVPLGVVERDKKPRYSPSDGSPSEGSELYKEKVIPISQDNFFEKALRQGQTRYSQGQRIAIIGEPGSGKTTRLQKIGDWILNKTDGIPIWIPLSAISRKELRNYLIEDWLQSAITELEVTESHRDELSQLLKTRNVWLLLDGVDEMAVSDPLHHLASQVHEGWLQNVRLVLTCRLNVWEAGKNTLDNFDIYRNLDFDYPGEVHQFIERWFPEKPDLQENLKEALEQPGKERIRDMIKNPLRLTLLCYGWHIRQGELPETKAELYKWFVDIFYEWNQGKVPNLTERKHRKLNQALGKLAKEALEQSCSRFRLREEFVTSFLGDAEDENSLFYLALQLGWLNHIGLAEENPFENVYAFFHPTFQEYLAALAIDDWDYFLSRNHSDKPISGKKYRIFESQWEEVALFWSGHADNQNIVEEFIEKLISFVDNCGGYYFLKSYLFASKITAEFDSIYSEEIISNLIDWKPDISSRTSLLPSISIKAERNEALLKASRQTVITKLKNKGETDRELEPVLIQLKLKDKRMPRVPFGRRPKASANDNSTAMGKEPATLSKILGLNAYTPKDFNDLLSILPSSGSFRELIYSINDVDILIDLRFFRM